MLCDMFSIPVCSAPSSESPALGVAVLAAVGAGIYDSVEAACKVMVRSGSDVLMPANERTALYKKFHALYKKLYLSLKDNYKTLANI